MKRILTTLVTVCVCSALLAACGEASQALGSGSRKDEPAYAGTGKAYMQPGWKPGDKTSWEAQLRARGQQGMNEYNKTPSP